MILPCLSIAISSNKGKGVFASEKIKANTTIEISPVIVFPVKEVYNIEKTLLFDYLFEWGKKRKKRALGLGYISLYNHSYSANCDYEMDFEFKIMTIKTVKNIEKGEELFINYNADPNNKTLVWFETN